MNARVAHAERQTRSSFITKNLPFPSSPSPGVRFTRFAGVERFFNSQSCSFSLFYTLDIYTQIFMPVYLYTAEILVFSPPPFVSFPRCVYCYSRRFAQRSLIDGHRYFRHFLVTDTDIKIWKLKKKIFPSTKLEKIYFYEPNNVRNISIASARHWRGT